MTTEEKLNKRLHYLAEKYETAEFLRNDPSRFMHEIDGTTNKELIAFIASSLSYGSRKQFILKIQLIIENINTYKAQHSTKEGEEVSCWLTNRIYEQIIPENSESFYRLYTNETYNSFLNALAKMIKQYGSIKNYLQNEHNIHPGEKINAIDAIESITKWFRTCNSKGVIPHNTNSCCKRLCMFMRWMVRTSSPVDLGLWSDIIDKRTLIMPMDTHVIQEAKRLNLLTSSSASMSNAQRLTLRLAKIFPNDPLQADFALFGLGVDRTSD